MTSHIKKFIALVCIITILFSFSAPFVKTTHAQLGVPISTTFDFNSIMGHVKSFVLDGLAWHVAKMMVQRITASTVQWINSGFSGSPSFLTNPSGFFADLGDQVTGAFIANTGILSGLCSPFNIDIRLSLALGQAGYGQVEKYTCTLNTVINNAKNTTINGASIKGFMGGDFKQGGWPAFIEISRPSNNASGAYLIAHSDLLHRIGLKQEAKQQQLSQGSGFLSFESCKTIDADTASLAVADTANDEYISTYTNFQNDIETKGINPTLIAQKNTYKTGDGTSIKSQVDPVTGVINYQNCSTETPGSVIEGQLNHILPAGADALNLADSINEIVDALMGQLVNKVLQTGLATVSSRPSGQTQSMIQQLSDQTNGTSTYAKDIQNIKNGYTSYATNAQTAVEMRQQAVDVFDKPLTDYGYAQKCYQDLLNKPSALFVDKNVVQSGLTSVNSDITDLMTDRKTYTEKLTEAQDNLAAIKQQAVLTINTPEDLQQALSDFQKFSSTNSSTIDTSLLNTNVDVAKSIADNYDKKANKQYNQCKALGGN